MIALGLLIAWGGLRTASTEDLGAVRPVLFGLSMIAAATALQLVPLPRGLLALVSPGADRALGAMNPMYAVGLIDWHPLSINPEATWRGFAFLVALGVFVSGAACAFAQRDIQALPRVVLFLGVAVALFGLAQRATFNGLIYWFWEPQFDSRNAFGPFVNRNHFAGWMVMAIAITAGYACGVYAGQPARRKRGLREIVTWLGSPEASQRALTMIAIATMAVALVATFSRSGILATATVILLFTVQAARRLPTARSRVVVAVLFLVAFLGGIAWRGFGALVHWYGETGTLAWRVALWRDTMPILRDFLVTGSGLNTYGTATMLYPASDPAWHAMEAHSDYLQIAVEGGLLLGIPVLVAIGFTTAAVVGRFSLPQSAMRYWLRVGAVVGVLGMAVQELVEFSLQMPGNAFLFATLLAVALHPTVERSSGTRRDATA
jgi:O-antigen ligase